MSDKDSDLGSMSLSHRLPVWNYFFGTIFIDIYSYTLGVEADMSDKDSDLGSMSLSHRLPVSDSSHRLCPSTAFGDMSQLSGKWNMCLI